MAILTSCDTFSRGTASRGRIVGRMAGCDSSLCNRGAHGHQCQLQQGLETLHIRTALHKAWAVWRLRLLNLSGSQISPVGATFEGCQDFLGLHVRRVVLIIGLDQTPHGMR